MTKPPHEDMIAERAMREMGTPLWADGPSLNTLVDGFSHFAVESAHLDSWLPMGSPRTQPIVVFFFHGLALRLADRLIVHQKVAGLALMFACINHLFPGKPIQETMKLVTELPIPLLDGSNKQEGFHMLGVKAADEWLANGLDSDPPMWQLTEVMKLVNKFAVEEAKNPDGTADLAEKLTHPNQSRSSKSSENDSG